MFSQFFLDMTKNEEKKEKTLQHKYLQHVCMMEVIYTHFSVSCYNSCVCFWVNICACVYFIANEFKMFKKPTNS